MANTSILIVEDEAIVAADLASKLAQLGYTIVGTAPSGPAAIALAKEKRPDLVLMDIQLTGPMDGIEAAEHIRRRCDIPVIYLTAHSDPATLERAKITEPFGYILKPFEEVGLETHIQMALYKHQSGRKLREHREWLRVTLNSIGDAVITTDTEGLITFINPVASSLTRWKAEEAVGQPARMLFRLINDETGEAADDVVACVLKEKRVFKLASQTSLITRDGHRVSIEDSAAPITDGAGSIIGVVLVFHDVTEKRRAEAALQQHRRQLEDRVAERTAELSHRSQELRALALALARVEQTERRQLAEFLHDHLQQLLVGARLQVEAMRMNPTRKYVGSSCGHVLDMLSEAIKASRTLTAKLSPPILHKAGLNEGLAWLVRWMKQTHDLDVELAASSHIGPEDSGASALIFQAVRELLFNVVKHAGVKQADLRLRKTQGLLKVTVTDGGVGFDVTAMAKASFGLHSISERLELLGGTFEIKSAPGKGTRATIKVPLPKESKHGLDQEFEVSEKAPATPAPVATPQAKACVRVLLADDHKLLRESLATLLREQGLDVVGEAANGREAVQRALELKPDVVLMDIQMPEMGGIEATRLITSKLSNVRVIGLSMHEEDDVGEAMRAAGAEAFVNKGAPSRQLLRAIRGKTILKRG